MAAFTIQVLGAQKLITGFDNAPATVVDETRLAMERGTTRIEGSARAKVRHRSGRLMGSISSKISGSGANLTGQVGPSVRYGLFVEKGTRPHWMPPGILPFPAMRAIATKGTKPYPFMQPAFEENQAAITADFAAIGFKVVQRIISG